MEHRYRVGLDPEQHGPGKPKENATSDPAAPEWIVYDVYASGMRVLSAPMPRAHAERAAEARNGSDGVCRYQTRLAYDVPDDTPDINTSPVWNVWDMGVVPEACVFARVPLVAANAEAQRLENLHRGENPILNAPGVADLIKAMSFLGITTRGEFLRTLNLFRYAVQARIATTENDILRHLQFERQAEANAGEAFRAMLYSISSALNAAFRLAAALPTPCPTTTILAILSRLAADIGLMHNAASERETDNPEPLGAAEATNVGELRREIARATGGGETSEHYDAAPAEAMFDDERA